MRFYYTCFLWLLGSLMNIALAQASFDQLPRDLQLYPRDGQNQAEVVISGNVSDASFQHLSIVVSREGNFWKYASQPLTSANGNSPFRVSFSIRAEPVEYDVKVFLRRGSDSTLVAERKRIVCGDVYILYGQSNVLGLAGLDDYQINDRLLRNATYPYNSTNIPADMRWYAARDPFGSVGMIGMELQRRILEQFGIPTLVINGGIGGASILELSQRNPGNPADVSTYYGSLLYRTQWAGVQNHIKAIIYKQGENEAGGVPDGYADKFRALYNQLRQDFGQQPKIYVGQINILTYTVPGAGDLRDFQRRTPQLFPNVASIASLGAVGYDGLHYEPRANQQIALEQFRLIARDIYGSSDVNQINSPDIKKIAFNDRRDELTLYFDDEMQMVWPRDTLIYNYLTGRQVNRSMKDFFYLNEQPGLITSGRAEGNRIILSLRSPQAGQTLTYLPPYYATDELPYYQGPYLTNARGMRAFSFSKVAIDATTIPTPNTPTNLVANVMSPSSIQLSWQDNATDETGYELERSTGNGSFSKIADLSANTTSFAMSGLSESTAYQFRIRAVNNVGPSPYSNIVSVSTPASLPLAPANLLAGATAPTSITLKWSDTAFNELSYELERSLAEGSFQKIADLPANSTNFTVSGLTENTAYRFRVRAVNSAGLSPYSNTASVVTPASLPLAPTNLTVVAVAPNSLTLIWNDNSFNETGFDLERSLGGGSFSTVTTITSNSNQLVVNGLTESSSYSFRIRAVNSAGASPYSNTITAATPASLPNAPTNLTAIPSNPTSISLIWMDNAFNETRYEVEQSLGQAEFQKIADVTPDVTTFLSTNLSEATTYRFRVRAVNSAGASPYSNIVTAMPLILGVEDPSLAIRLYPNPLSTTRILHVEHDRPIFTAFRVYSLIGSLVKSESQRATNHVQISFENLLAGLYIVELQTTSGSFIRQKILVY